MKQVLLSDVCEINPRIDSGISDDAECLLFRWNMLMKFLEQLQIQAFVELAMSKKGYTFFKKR